MKTILSKRETGMRTISVRGKKFVVPSVSKIMKGKVVYDLLTIRPNERLELVDNEFITERNATWDQFQYALLTAQKRAHR